MVKPPICSVLNYQMSKTVIIAPLRYVGSLGSPLESPEQQIYSVHNWMWKKNLRKCLHSTKIIFQRLLIILHEHVCKQPSVILKNALPFCKHSLAPVRNVSSQVHCFSDDFLQVAICTIVSASRFLILRQDGYCLCRVGHNEPSHALVSRSIRTLISQGN